MMPLWTTTMRPVQSRCGWAFSSVGRPCVAQRVCPMPYSPSRGLPAITSSRRASLPALRRSSIWPFLTTATPAESYPRYSRRRSPSMRIGTTSLSPIYPMIPHMVQTPEMLRSLLPVLLDPTLFIDLLAARDPERARRHVLDDRRARGDIRPLADAHGSHQLRVAADERAVLD